MKINKWTLGLAAVGLVSLTPGMQAQTPPAPAPAPAASAPAPVPVVTALSATTISGYVDTSAVWNPGTGNANPAPYSFNAGKQDGFNVNSVDIKISKAEDESQWAAGYVVELMYGPDAALSGNAPLRQAYVSLHTPVGNGIDWQIGQWDNLLGYESSDSYKNPNWTRSYGYTIEPTEHTGILASYKINDMASVQVGVANTVTTLGGNARNVSGAGGSAIESKKAVVSLLTLTAPDSFGGWKGSALYAGLDYGPGVSANNVNGSGVAGHVVDKTHLYVGATINTPVSGLTLGAAWDSVNNMDTAGVGGVEGAATTIAAYVSYKITDKITSNLRAEYAHGSAFDGAGFANGAAPGTAGALPINLTLPNGVPQEAKVFAVTETIQYDLWANVISRLEVRWDTSADGSPHFGGTTPSTFAAAFPTKNNEIMVAANIIYKF